MNIKYEYKIKKWNVKKCLSIECLSIVLYLSFINYWEYYNYAI